MRLLVPELLDVLAPDDPRAIASRRDLVRINWMMRQPQIVAGALAKFPPPATLADLGGGDGKFLLQVARQMAARWPGVKAMILDKQNIVSGETCAGFRSLGWTCEIVAGDVFDTLPRQQPDIALANLFLHHFDNAGLTKLLAVVAAGTRGFVACEPRRSALALAGSRLVFLLGANDVTRHDAIASVRAGFTGHDLSVLWPAGGQWQIGERAVWPFSHLFEAAHV